MKNDESKVLFGRLKKFLGLLIKLFGSKLSNQSFIHNLFKNCFFNITYTHNLNLYSVIIL